MYNQWECKEESVWLAGEVVLFDCIHIATIGMHSKLYMQIYGKQFIIRIDIGSKCKIKYCKSIDLSNGYYG